jgi:hypothetical protein
LIISVLGPGGAVRARGAGGLRGNAILAFFLTFPDTVTAFTFTITRRISRWHAFHFIFLLYPYISISRMNCRTPANKISQQSNRFRKKMSLRGSDVHL